MMRTFKIYSLSDVQIYSPILLTIAMYYVESPGLIYLLTYLFIYLAALDLSRTCGIFLCGMWDLVP